MASATLGETLYAEWIAREGRTRLTYDAGNRLKAVTSIAELRELCTGENSAAFDDDATPMEMIDAWLTVAPAKSDADSVGELLLGGGLEGCGIIVLFAPLVLSGYVIGSCFRGLGINLQSYFQSRPRFLPDVSYLSLPVAWTANPRPKNGQHTSPLTKRGEFFWRLP